MSDSQAPLHETWRKVVEELFVLTSTPDSGLQPLGPQQRAYLQLVKPVALVEGVAVLAVPHAKAKEIIETELGTAITQVLGMKMGRAFALAVTIDPSVSPEPVPVPAHVQASPAPRQEAPVEEPRAEYRFEEPHTAGNNPFYGEQSHVTTADSLRHQVAPEFQMSGPELTPTTATLAPQEAASAGWETTHAPAAPADSGFKRNPQAAPKHAGEQPVSLNPLHTFDNYVVSDSNKLPASAAIAVAEKPARAYNPLFIWGDSGLGKTHLMHAIGNYAHQLHPRLKIKYVSSEEFTNDYINSVRDDRQESFKRRYREVDILMVDDIQFLQGKEGTQEEFFHTFNALEQGGKQIVLSSDRPPKQLTTLEDRLRTRFQAGLIADIYPPDLETRIAILSKKSRADGIETDREVLELIASRFDSSIRELEGAFIRVSAYASVNKLELNRETAEIALRSISPDQSNIEITPETIIEVTADYFQIRAQDLKGTTKTRNIAHARQIAMYLCRELTELSLPKIGESFGGKDHTTVMYADRKIRKDIGEKRDTYNEIQQITNQIKRQGNS
ncbi:chromosomal replication initiator protein DnaA [Corynebacterium vitaeruminis]|uniref:chromosomal replication initiator protein DnaA n=1 Tax=Corynebacterium vitaeruminis TaxID=38305 RepID=UPI0023F09357|nr:chromosomal replication initiator protein DnaA [Corynebacterium vitaeruminis]